MTSREAAAARASRVLRTDATLDGVVALFCFLLACDVLHGESWARPAWLSTVVLVSLGGVLVGFVALLLAFARRPDAIVLTVLGIGNALSAAVIGIAAFAMSAGDALRATSVLIAIALAGVAAAQLRVARAYAAPT